MSEPIISPWLIYFINLVEHISFVSFLGTLICIGLCFISAGMKHDFRRDSDVVAEANTVLKWALPTGIICLLLTILIPSKETCYQMLVASYVTPETINATIDGAENIAKRALDLITDSVIKIIKEIN